MHRCEHLPPPPPSRHLPPPMGTPMAEDWHAGTCTPTDAHTRPMVRNFCDYSPALAALRLDTNAKLEVHLRSRTCERRSCVSFLFFFPASLLWPPVRSQVYFWHVCRPAFECRTVFHRVTTFGVTQLSMGRGFVYSECRLLLCLEGYFLFGEIFEHSAGAVRFPPTIGGGE